MTHRSSRLLCFLTAFLIGATGTPLFAQQSLQDARAGFQTNLIPNAYEPDAPVAEPPPNAPYVKVTYPSPAGQLAAYLTPDPKDGRKRPAIIWAHGGFGGIDPSYWAKQPAANDQTPNAFLDAGIVVMIPSWRGENENPGKFELFFGEVDDALAALDYVSKLPYVDPNRVYFAGHSSGGTVALLTALSTDKPRAVFSFGGSPDIGRVVADGRGYGNTPFDIRNPQESRLRSAIHFVTTLKTPTWYFEGANAFSAADAQRMDDLARRAGVPFQAFIIPGANHFNILRPLTRLVAEKIVADAGPTPSIRITSGEVATAYARVRNELRAKLARLPLATVTPEAARLIQAVMTEQKMDPAKTYLRLKPGGLDLTEEVSATSDVTTQSNGINVVAAKAQAPDLRGATVHYVPGQGGLRVIPPDLD